MFHDQVTEFAGKEEVVDWDGTGELVHLETSAYRIGLDWEDDDDLFMTRFRSLLEDRSADRLESLIIGPWFTEDYFDCSGIVETLVAAAGQLTSLKSLFIGDITFEQCEVSWIELSDLSAIFGAFPRLETLRIRGSQDLAIGTIQHDCLRSLTIECGGLPGQVLKDLAQSNLPSLEWLDLHLGTENYGWSGSIDDVVALLNNQFPKLTHLGLVDSEIQDEVTKAILESPLVGQIRSLDISKGILTDEGGNALLSSEAVKNLDRLTIVHHYLSQPVQDQISALPVDTTIEEGDSPDEEYKYVAVGE